MSKERLEKIKRESKGVVWNTETDEDLLTELDTPDFEWLIKQAERADVLEDKLSEVCETEFLVDIENKKLKQQNKRYRELVESNLVETLDYLFNRTLSYASIEDLDVSNTGLYELAHLVCSSSELALKEYYDALESESE